MDGNASIKVAGLSEFNPYEGYEYMSVLGEDNKVLSLNQTSRKSKGITGTSDQDNTINFVTAYDVNSTTMILTLLPTLQNCRIAIVSKDPVHKEGIFVFKVLLSAPSTDPVTRPKSIYPRASSALLLQSVMVSQEPADGPHTNPTPPAAASPTLETNGPVADIDTTKQHTPGYASVTTEPALSSSGGIKSQDNEAMGSAHENDQQGVAALNSPYISKASLSHQTSTHAVSHDEPRQFEFQDAASQNYTEDAPLLLNRPTFVRLSTAILEYSTYDVHFYHHDRVKGVSNLVMAHLAKLEEYPTLSRYVDKSWELRNDLAVGIKPRMNETSPVTLRAPVMVDISYLSYPAFKALTEYIYTRDVEGILAKVSADRPTSFLPSSETLPARQTAVVTEEELELHLDELLRVADVFDIHELFDICVKKLVAGITDDNALQILTHLGESFLEIKEPVTIYIQDRILGKNRLSSELNEMVYKNPQAL